MGCQRVGCLLDNRWGPPLAEHHACFAQRGRCWSTPGALAGIGAGDLWLPVHEVVGVVPPGTGVDGSTRGAGIERSTNGGRSWMFTRFPGVCRSVATTSISASSANLMVSP